MRMHVLRKVRLHGGAGHKRRQVGWCETVGTTSLCMTLKGVVTCAWPGTRVGEQLPKYGRHTHLNVKAGQRCVHIEGARGVLAFTAAAAALRGYELDHVARGQILSGTTQNMVQLARPQSSC